MLASRVLLEMCSTHSLFQCLLVWKFLFSHWHILECIHKQQFKFMPLSLYFWQVKQIYFTLLSHDKPCYSTKESSHSPLHSVFFNSSDQNRAYLLFGLVLFQLSLAVSNNKRLSLSNESIFSLGKQITDFLQFLFAFLLPLSHILYQSQVQSNNKTKSPHFRNQHSNRYQKSSNINIAKQ